MGSVSSSIMDTENGGGQTGLGDVPESCVAEIFLRLDPPEICSLARVSRAFRGAAAADFVWEAKLPKNYKYLLRKALGWEEDADVGSCCLSKKEIFAKLCRRNLLDGGNMEFFLHKHRCQIGMLISSKAHKNLLRTREVRELVSGALAGAMAKAVLAPLETIRTRMIVGIGSKYISGSFLEIVEKNGWQGLWAGNTINMIRIVPTQAIELATFECVKRNMTSIQEHWKENGSPKLQIGHINLDLSFLLISPVAIGGAAAGIASTLMCHPLEVLKDRLTVNREAYPNISIACSRICKSDGIGGFYAGISPTLIGMLPYSTCYYFMYETMKNSYLRAKKKKALSRAELVIVGALSGLTASTISFPLEVARKRLMVGALQGKCPPNMAAALSEVVREEGLLGLYRGWGASCLKVMPNSGITWMFYEAWKEVLLAGRLNV